MLTRRPLLEQERHRLRCEQLLSSRDDLAELMEDVPTLKADTEVIRSPKRKRIKPKPGPVVSRPLEILERAA